MQAVFVWVVWEYGEYEKKHKIQDIFFGVGSFSIDLHAD